MSNSQTGRFAYSFDEESYHGRFGTLDEALAEATAEAIGNDSDRFWLGECVPPPSPEDFWEANDWLENVSCQDSYSHDWAEDWDRSTNEQREELEKEVRSAMAAWMDRHNLRPNFFLIENPVEYRMEGDTAVRLERIKK